MNMITTPLPSESARIESTSSARSRVLIVEDEAQIRQFMARALRRQAYEVEEVPDGEACIERLRQGFEGIILMDIQMPGLSGWQTIEVLVKEGLLGRSLICMETGTGQPGQDSAGLEEYIFDYLAKPFGIAALRMMVENAANYLRSEGTSDSEA